MSADKILDGIGIYGTVLHYSMLFLFTGGALLIFLYLWYKGKLDMDEEPKEEMMKSDEQRLSTGKKQKKDVHNE